MAKIMMISTAHTSMDVRILQKEATALAQAGHDVSFLVTNDKEETCKGIKIIPIKKTKSRKMRIFLRPFSVIRAVHKHKPDILHAHDPELLPALIWLKLFGYTTVYDSHEDFPAQTLSKYWIAQRKRKIAAWWAERYINFCVRHMHQVIAATPFIRDRLLPSNKNTEVVNNYPKLSEFSEMKPWETRMTKIAFVGGANKIRGFGEIIDSLELCKIPLEFAGEIEPKEFKEALQSAPGWQYVEERGTVPRSEVAEILGRCKIGIVTYYPEPNHVSAQPNKFFEYMAVGIPMVVSDFPHWRGLLENYNCARFVDPQNPEELAREIQWLSEHDEEAKSMGERGRKAVLEEYNWECEAKALCEIYQRLIERRKLHS